MALSIVGRLLFDGKRWQTGLNDARRQAQTFGKQVPSVVTSGFKSITTALAGAVSAGVIAGQAKASIERAVASLQAADKLGISTDAVQELQHAAAQADTDFSKVETAVVQLNAKLAQIASGGGKEAAEVFTRLGINAGEFLGMAPDKQLLRLSEAFKTVGASVADVNYLFGESGKEIVPFLKADLQGSINEARRLGLVISQQNLQSLSARGAELNRMERLGQATSSDFTALLPSLGPLAEQAGRLRVAGRMGDPTAGLAAAAGVTGELARLSGSAARILPPTSGIGLIGQVLKRLDDLVRSQEETLRELKAGLGG